MCSAGQTCADPPDPTRIFTRQQFAQGLTCLRKRAGLAVRQVARLTGIPSGTLGDYYSGRSLPAVNQPDVLPKILWACGVTDKNVVREWEKALRRVRDRPQGTPYRGLEFFGTKDTDWFFGRERLTARLVMELAGRYDGGGPLVVIGVSGSGKSSLLRAGLIPALRRGDLDLRGPQNWPCLLLTPGDHPLKELADKLAPKIKADPVDVEQTLRSDPRTTADLARRVCGAHDAGDTSDCPGSRLVVVVDQFEEVFTSCVDEAERSAFIAALWATAASSGKPADTASDTPAPPAALVVLGLRADFYSHALQRADLLPALQGHMVVEPMTEGGLRDAIVKPAEKAGVDLEDGLVELLLRELRPGPRADEGQDDRTECHDSPAHEPGALPLLSHALHVTWQRRRQRGRMTVAEYKAGGGIWGALKQTAHEAFRELTTEQQKTAQQLFLRLVHITDDTADTRRRVSLAELRDISENTTQSEELAAVLNQFVERRLITVGRDHVEIAHDSLLSAWPLLREWINANRARLVIIRRLTEDAQVWEAKGRDRDRLYRGNQLALAEEAGTADPIALPQVACNFLKASVAARRRWAYTRSAVIIVTAILLVVSTTAALMAYQAKNDRRQDASRALASYADRIRVKEPYLALLLAIAAYRIAPTDGAHNSLLYSRRSYKMMPLKCGGADCHNDAVAAVRWVERRSDKTDVLMTAGHDGKVNVWRTSSDGSPPVRENVFDHGNPIQAAALSSDGAIVATAGRDGSIRAWDTKSGRMILEADHGALVYDIAFHSKNPDIVATAGDDGVVKLLSLSGKPTVPLPAGDNSLPVYAVAFSQDGRLLATAHGDGTVKLWNANTLLSETPELRKNFTTQTTPHPIQVLAFSLDSEKLAIGADEDVLLCETAEIVLENRDDPVCKPLAKERAGPVRALTFSPVLGETVLTGGDKLLVGADDASVRLLDTTTRALQSLYTGPTDNVLGVAFSPNGKTIAAAGSGKTIGLWEVQAGPESGTGDGSPSRSTENPKPDDVIDWVCGYHPTPVLSQWPESISAEFRRDIC